MKKQELHKTPVCSGPVTSKMSPGESGNPELRGRGRQLTSGIALIQPPMRSKEIEAATSATRLNSVGSLGHGQPSAIG